MISTTSALISTSSASVLGALGEFFSPVSLVTKLFLLYFLIFWVSLVFWLTKDMAKRPIDEDWKKYFSAAVVLFNVLGVFLYLIWRPPTHEEIEKDKMEDEILRLELKRLRQQVKE
ncbi:MAG: hypothetical protein Q8N84_02035 [bacterium]|nr:hypothetical protein [bacterium]